jgi:hypothetical protein
MKKDILLSAKIFATNLGATNMDALEFSSLVKRALEKLPTAEDRLEFLLEVKRIAGSCRDQCSTMAAPLPVRKRLLRKPRQLQQ